MSTRHRATTHSLYFDYPYFPFVRPPEMAGQAVRQGAVSCFSME